MANADPTLPDVDPPSPRDPTLTPAEPTSASVDPKWGSTGPKPADVAPPPSRDLAATPGGPALTSGGLPSPSAAPEPPPPAPAQRRPRPAAAILGRGGGRGGPVAMGRVSMATPGAPTAAESPRPLPWRCARTAAPASASAGQWEGGTAHFRPLTSGLSDFRCFFSGFRSERGAIAARPSPRFDHSTSGYTVFRFRWSHGDGLAFPAHPLLGNRAPFFPTFPAFCPKINSGNRSEILPPPTPLNSPHSRPISHLILPAQDLRFAQNPIKFPQIHLSAPNFSHFSPSFLPKPLRTPEFPPVYHPLCERAPYFRSPPLLSSLW